MAACQDLAAYGAYGESLSPNGFKSIAPGSNTKCCSKTFDRAHVQLSELCGSRREWFGPHGNVSQSHGYRLSFPQPLFPSSGRRERPARLEPGSLPAGERLRCDGVRHLQVGLDSNLVKLIPKEVEVHRTWTLEPPFRLRKRLWALNTKGSTRQGTPSFAARAKSLLSNRVKKLICPDPQILWYPFAVRRASQLVRDRQIQTVLVTAPPFSAFLIANELKKRFPHLFVIADVRDELASFVRSFVFQGDEYVSARAMQIERETVECCDRIVAVTSGLRQAMKRRYPEQPDQKFALIPNGYDPAAFADFRSRSHQSNKLVFTYTGLSTFRLLPKRSWTRWTACLNLTMYACRRR